MDLDETGRAVYVRMGGQSPYEEWVTDAELVHLEGLTNLEELNLMFTWVTDAGLAELRKALPNCKIYG